MWGGKSESVGKESGFLRSGRSSTITLGFGNRLATTGHSRWRAYPLGYWRGLGAGGGPNNTGEGWGSEERESHTDRIGAEATH